MAGRIPLLSHSVWTIEGGNGRRFRAIVGLWWVAYSGKAAFSSKKEFLCATYGGLFRATLKFPFQRNSPSCQPCRIVKLQAGKLAHLTVVSTLGRKEVSGRACQNATQVGLFRLSALLKRFALVLSSSLFCPMQLVQYIFSPGF